MAISIDVENQTCGIILDGVAYTKPIGELVITTDHQARMSQLEVGGQLVHISEDDAQRLIGVGAVDDRSHVKTGEI